jgi:hypothetical protein
MNPMPRSSTKSLGMAQRPTGRDRLNKAMAGELSSGPRGISKRPGSNSARRIKLQLSATDYGAMGAIRSILRKAR